MFWSPNGEPKDWATWYPNEGQVDVAGIDVYPKEQKSFSDAYRAFCKQYPNILSAIGKTGAGPGLKENWFKELVSPQGKTACPKYVGFS